MNNIMLISNIRHEQTIFNLISFLDKNTSYKAICYKEDGTLLTVWRKYTGKSTRPIIIKTEYNLSEYINV